MADNKGLNGLILIDKPEGMSSFKVVSIIKGILRVKKIGHAGTLDPMATGLLPVCIGRATKLAQFIMAGMKVYKGCICLGRATDTYDMEGHVVKEAVVPQNMTKEYLVSKASAFTGWIKQTPPPFSALKHNGKPLYVLARKGIMIEKEARRCFIASFDITSYKWLSEKEALAYFTVSCSKGTYIRSLANDFGIHIGTYAFLHSLCRERIGQFSIKEAITIEDAKYLMKKGNIKDAVISGEDILSRSMPSVRIDYDLASFIARGGLVEVEFIKGLLERQGIGSDDPISPFLRLECNPSNGGSHGTSTTIAVFEWPQIEGKKYLKFSRVLPDNLEPLRDIKK